MAIVRRFVAFHPLSQMAHPQLSLCALALALPIFASACGGPSLVTTIDGLSSDLEQEGVFRLDQNRMVSLMGNAPGNVPGEILHFKNERALSSTFGLTCCTSYVDIFEVPPPKGEDAATCVIEVREKIFAAQQAAADLVAAKVKVALAQYALDNESDASALDAARQTLSQAEEVLDKSRAMARKTATDASKAVSKPGIVVFRWTTQEDSSQSLLGFIRASFGSERETHGYTIAAGWRENMLVVGNDIDELAVPLDSYWDWFVLKWGWLPWIGESVKGKYARITTRTIQTQAVAFLKDELTLQQLKAEVKASVEDLSSTQAALAAIDSVEVAIAYKRAFNLTTEGVLANCERRHVQGIVEKMKQGDLHSEFKSWLTLVAVDVNYHHLLDLMKDQSVESSGHHVEGSP